VTAGSGAPEDVFRTESGRVLGALMRRFGNLDLAEDAYQDACLAAVETWPRDGVPHNPGAWLTTVAGNRALDRIRRERGRLPREVAALGWRPTSDGSVGPPWAPAADEEAVLDADEAVLADDQLRLLFLCCHPALAEDARVALTLRTVGGLTTAEIAHAFLVPEPTMAQRLVRAKRKVALAGIPFRMPAGRALDERIAAVLHTVYLVFNEGYSATGQDIVVRADLCDEAVRLSALLVRLLPDDAEVLGLRALLVLQDARRAGRVDSAGMIVPLAEQDRSRWDLDRIREGVELVERALRTGPVGPYQLEAAIAALHAEAPTYDVTDWPQIVALYDLLALAVPGPTVQLNRAVAVAMRDGPAAGLAELDALAARGELPPGHRVPAARAQLLEQLGRTDEALSAYDEALALAGTRPERDYLTGRRATLAASTTP
jgi:RNA polymerase sigma-70 factor (ECF subfamily)